MRSVCFLSLALASSWGLALGLHSTGLTSDPTLGGLIAILYMAGPGVAALICAAIFDHQSFIKALGLQFKPNPWWVAAWLSGIAIAAASVGATVLLGGASLGDINESIVDTLPPSTDPGRIAAIRASPNMAGLMVASAATIGVLLNAPIVTLTEEIGWRGYLFDVWSKHGFWRCALGTGVVWGVWHIPAIVVLKQNYPEAPLVGSALFVVWCVLLSPVIAWIRERGASVWAAGILHAALNSLGSVTVLALDHPPPNWSGLLGIGGLVSLAGACLFVALHVHWTEQGEHHSRHDRQDS